MTQKIPVLFLFLPLVCVILGGWLSFRSAREHIERFFVSSWSTTSGHVTDSSMQSSDFAEPRMLIAGVTLCSEVSQSMRLREMVANCVSDGLRDLPGGGQLPRLIHPLLALDAVFEGEA